MRISKANLQQSRSCGQTTWGLSFDSKGKTVGVPEVKLIKAQIAVGDVELGYGFTRVEIHTLRVLRGGMLSVFRSSARRCVHGSSSSL